MNDDDGNTFSLSNSKNWKVHVDVIDADNDDDPKKKKKMEEKKAKL